MALPPKTFIESLFPRLVPFVPIREDDFQALWDEVSGGLSNTETVVDIAARDALTANEEVIVRVLDATDDATVDVGSAWYQWDSVGLVYQKISETESNNIEQATEILRGIAELATEAESVAGTDDLRIVTPFKLSKVVFPGIEHIGDGILTSLSITDLNKTYYVKCAATTTTVDIPDSVAANDGKELKIFKFDGAGNLDITTVGGTQLIGGSTTQTVVNDGEGIGITSDVGNPTDDWFTTQDNRSNKITINTGVAYDASEDWEFDFLNIGSSTADIDATFPASLAGFKEGSTRTITNSNDHLVYVRSNGHTINGEVTDYRILSDGYLRLTLLDGAIQITGNYSSHKDIDIEAMTDLELFVDSTDTTTYTAGASITSVTSKDPLDREFEAVDNNDAATSIDIGYNATGTPNGRPSFVFNGTDNLLRVAGDGTIHDNTNGLYFCIAFKPVNRSDTDSIISQFRSTSSERVFKVAPSSYNLSKAGAVIPDSDKAIFTTSLDEWNIVECVWEGSGDVQATLSGVKAGVSDGTVGNINTETARLTMGGVATNDTNDLYEGETAIIVALSRVPSDEDRGLLLQKVADKIGFDINKSLPQHEIFRVSGNTVVMRDADDRLNVDYTGDGTNNKVFTAADEAKLDGIESLAEVNAPASETWYPFDIPNTVTLGQPYTFFENFKVTDSGDFRVMVLIDGEVNTLMSSYAKGVANTTDGEIQDLLAKAITDVLTGNNSFDSITGTTDIVDGRYIESQSSNVHITIHSTAVGTRYALSQNFTILVNSSSATVTANYNTETTDTGTSAYSGDVAVTGGAAVTIKNDQPIVTPEEIDSGAANEGDILQATGRGGSEFKELNVDGAIYNDQSLPYTLLNSDKGKIVRVTTAGTLTIPNGLDADFNCVIMDNDGLGGKVISQTTATNLKTTANPTGANLTLDGQYAQLSIAHQGSDVYVAVGEAS